MMMVDMEMEMEMEIEDNEFVCDEIDFDYEFDAARFFDFTAPETTAQARQAETWFQTAGSYCPSPFVANLLLKEEDPKPNFGSKAVCGSGNVSGSLGVGVLQNDAMQVQPGMTFNSKTINGNLNSKAKSAARKGSTLMKPTASQLAKQNRPPQIIRSRLQKIQAHTKEMNLSTSDKIEIQAAKRQKLEGGLLRKVGEVKQKATLVHKAPKQVFTVDECSGHSKLKITIPREPDLKTAHRAERIRPKNAAEAELVTVAAPRFKARRLNRKILEAPSLPLPKRSTPRLPEFHEFHLKTSERAMHTPAASSSTLQCDGSHKDLNKHTAVSAPENIIRDLRRPSTMVAPKHDVLDFGSNFKARPLNKKILSSKGDIGVFWNRKQETTVPTEFNFHTEKRVQHNPPIDLFSKLSLTSEVQSNDGSHLKPPRHSRVFRKDSKENMGSSFHLNQKDKPFIFGGKQTQNETDGCTGKAGTLSTARRSLGIR